MPLINTGHSIDLNWSILSLISNNATLSNIALSTELNQYSYLEPSRRLPNGKRIKIPSYLSATINSIFMYKPQTNSWQEITNYELSNDIIEFESIATDTVLGFSSGSFKDNFYRDGEYIYEFYMSRLDDRIYKNFVLSVSSHMYSNNITLFLSKSNSGPWFTELRSYTILDVFYVKVIVQGFKLLIDDIIVPSELISINCLVCE